MGGKSGALKGTSGKAAKVKGKKSRQRYVPATGQASRLESRATLRSHLPK
jgi:hypothetical protein